MADQEHGARIRLQQLLEQLERVDVEVVRRLVEDEHVGRQREQPRQQDTVALAARKRAQRRVGARRREQEVGEVAHHVLPAARGLDPLAARADRCRRASRRDRARCASGRSRRPRCACRGAPCPRSAASSPRISFSSVVLPAPFGPIRPILSPRRSVAQKPRTIVCARRPARSTIETSRSSATILPLGTPGVGLEPDAAERLAPCAHAARAAPAAAGRGRRCACVAPRRPCAPRPPPARAACRRARSRAPRRRARLPCALRRR